MKSLLALSVMLVGFQASAASQVLLACKNIDQTDISKVLVRTFEDPAKKFSYELLLMSPQGEETSIEIDSEDYNEGWISLPNDDVAERYLIRQEDGWEIFGTIGQAQFTSPAECEEAPLY